MNTDYTGISIAHLVQTDQKEHPKLSQMYQTSQIGTFHSTVNNFALKMVVFSHYNIYDRYVGVNNFICSITCGCSSWWLGGRKFVVYIFQDWRLLLSIWRGHIESACCYKGSDHALQKKLMEKTACNLIYGNYNPPPPLVFRLYLLIRIPQIMYTL